MRITLSYARRPVLTPKSVRSHQHHYEKDHEDNAQSARWMGILEPPTFVKTSVTEQSSITS
jgi:hypothetical protein